MTLIDNNDDLRAFCERQMSADFIAVDTEFLRDKTYWPQLCLIQIAGPQEAAAIDPLIEAIDLTPLYHLMMQQNIVKVFHASRQDIEIFYHEMGTIPTPLFDTQVAAMVCGFGESVGYETLAAKLAGAKIDKSSRFTDWSRRPLTAKQLDYALSDVTYLRDIYEKLLKRLTETERELWLQEEMNILSAPETYRLNPEDAWKRLKTRKASKRFMAILKELAHWREALAQQKNVPRSRILRDETIMDLSAQAPNSVGQLARARSMSKGTAEGKTGTEILEAIKRGLKLEDSQIPEPQNKVELPNGIGPLIDLLKVLLKMNCENHEVAQKLVANISDLEDIAVNGDLAQTSALKGWRRDIFGKDALKLLHGELALTCQKDHIAVIRFEEGQSKIDKPRPRRRHTQFRSRNRHMTPSKSSESLHEGAAFTVDGVAAQANDD